MQKASAAILLAVRVSAVQIYWLTQEILKNMKLPSASLNEAQRSFPESASQIDGNRATRSGLQTSA